MPGGTYLDLATGNGDLVFAVAGQQSKAHVIGIDIADLAISRNQTSAREQGYTNVEFLVSDGRMIDFPNASFDGVTWRYALHHFPQVETTLADVRRVLRPTASLVVADAIRDPKDDGDFINRFQALEPDGHVRIYTANGLVDLFRAIGFKVQRQFRSTIMFTRHLNADYRDLIDGTPVSSCHSVSISKRQAY
jgi:ubiquinone/menaquinone biosynthesis C-methylase UbiE